MKLVACLVFSISLAGCLRDENTVEYALVQTHSPRTIHYVQLAVGDSLGYDWAALDTGFSDFYAHIEGTTLRQGKTYFNMVDYPIAGAYPQSFLIREADNGDIYEVGLFDTAIIEKAVESLLYKTSAQVGDSWNLYFFGDTIKCTMISRSDTVRTYADFFRGCLRIRIQYWWGEYEDEWLAPGVGLVRRDFQTISARPIFMPLLDLKDVRLKSATRR